MAEEQKMYQLNELEMEILKILAVLGQPVTFTSIKQALKHKIRKFPNTIDVMPTGKSIQRSLYILEKRKLINNDYHINDNPREKILKSIEKDGDQKGYSYPLFCFYAPCRSPSAKYNQILHTEACLRASLWSENKNWILSTFKDILIRKSWDKKSLFFKNINNFNKFSTPDDLWIFMESLSKEISKYSTIAFLRGAARGYIPITDKILKRSQKLLSEEHQILVPRDELCWILGNANQLTETMTEPTLIAIQMLFSGKRLAAMKILQKKRKIERSKTSINLPLSGLAGCLLELIEVSLRKTAPDKSLQRFKYALTYQRYSDYACGEEKIFTPANSICDFTYWVVMMLAVYDLYIRKESLESNKRVKFINHAKDLMISLYENRHFWSLSQFIGVLKSLNAPKEIYETYDVNLPSFVMSIGDPLPDRWEMQIQKFEQDFGIVEKQKKTSTATTTQSILTWRIDSKGVGLTPYLKILSKSGKWSKGRLMALRTLAEGQIPEYLSSLDKKICARIVCENIWFRDKTFSLSNASKHAKELAEHPHIYLEENPDKKANIELIKPKMILKKKSHTLHLELSEKTEELLQSQHEVKKISDDTFQFLFLEDDKDRLLLKHAQSKIIPTFPMNKISRCYGLLQHINSKIKIENLEQIFQNSVKEISAKCKVRAYLTIENEYLYVEFLVQPFGNGQGPTLSPGSGRETIIDNIDGNMVRCTRDFNAEMKNWIEISKALKFLTKDGSSMPVKLSLEKYSPNALNLLDTLKDLQDKKLLDWLWKSDHTLKTSNLFDNKVKIQLNESKSLADWFSFSGTVKVSPELDMHFDILLAELAQNNSRFVKVTDDHFLALTEEMAKKLRVLAKMRSINKDGLIPHAGLFAIDNLTRNADFEIECSNDWKNKLDRIRKKKASPAILNQSFKATLRPYQNDGFQWLSRMEDYGFGVCLADDMGLGKTIQCLALLTSKQRKSPILIVTPTSLALNWKSESQKYAPSLNVTVMTGTDRLEAMKPSSGKVFVTSYGQLVKDIDELKKISWSVVILDECQAIKNPLTQRAQACRQLSTKFRIGVSGTPIENNLEELWSLFWFINPGLLGTREYFRENFCRIADTESQSDLKRLISPFVLRRTKNEVLKELPKKVEKTLIVPPSKQEAAFYTALRNKIVEKLDSLPPQKRYVEALAGLMKLRRAACHTSLIDPDSTIPSSKHAAMNNLLEEVLANGHKILIFSQFVDHLHIIRSILEEKEISYQYLDGSVPAKKRQESVTDFQSGNRDVFLISLKAGGFGLNLTAADFVLHLDPWWNPAVEDQASDRSHRIGQKRTVHIYRIVMQGSIEEKMIQLHQKKRDLAQQVLSHQGKVGRLSGQEIVDLLMEHQEKISDETIKVPAISPRGSMQNDHSAHI